MKLTKMGADLKIAYENTSSITARYTPEDFGKLLSSARADELEEILNVFIKESTSWLTCDTCVARLKRLEDATTLLKIEIEKMGGI